MEKKLDSSDFENLSFKPLDCSTKYEEILNFTKMHGSSDIDTLNLELEFINNEFNKTLKKLDEIDFEFTETIDKNSFELLHTNYEELFQLHEKLKIDLENTENEMMAWKEEHDVILKECEVLKLNLETSKRSSTPRPEWRKCTKIIDGGEKAWDKLSRNKSSEELIDLLINEFLGTYAKPNEDGFCLSSLPTIKPVPSYFLASINDLSENLKSSTNLTVINRRLNRFELGVCIKELWNARLSKYFENESNEKMSEFLIEYFLDKFKSHYLAIEWAVNLKESCERFFKYERASFLLDTLNKKKDENIIFHLYSVFRKFSLNFSSKSSYEYLKLILIKKFPAKNSDQINFLIESITKKMAGAKFTFQEIFDENDNDLECIISCLNDQINEEKKAYIKNILNNIKMNSNKISIYDFIECIEKVDPNICEKDLKKYCDWLFDKKSKFYLIEKDELIEKLKNGDFHSHVDDQNV